MAARLTRLDRTAGGDGGVAASRPRDAPRPALSGWLLGFGAATLFAAGAAFGIIGSRGMAARQLATVATPPADGDDDASYHRIGA